MNGAAKRDVDAVRYIVLRKLASGLRHTLMGELQSIQFLAELGTRLLQNGAEQSKVSDCVGKIPLAASEAIATGHSVIEWLRPEERATTTLDEAVGQCVRLAGDGWRMRATVATVEMPGQAGEARVSKAAARELVITALLALTDENPGPLDIGVTAEPNGSSVQLRVDARVSGRVSPFRPSIVYHALTLADVEQLAAQHNVACTCEDGAVTFRFDLAKPEPEEAQRGTGAA